MNRAHDLRRPVAAAAIFLMSLMLAALLVWAPALFSSTFTYHRWDNLEYFVPVIKWVHGNWLSGHFPAVNLNQHLGEPFAANIQGGYFYPVYMAAVLIQRLVGCSDSTLIALILMLNLSIGIAGLFCLGEFWGLPRTWSCAVAAAGAGGAYNMAYAGVWINVTAIHAWLPWCLLGILEFHEAHEAAQREGRKGRPTGGLRFAVAMGMLGQVGHPQFWLYALLFMGLAACLLFAGRPKVLLQWMPYPLVAILLAMPTLLPLLLYLPLTPRAHPFSLEEFLSLSAQPSDLMGFLTPWTGHDTLPLPPAHVSLLTFQGVYLLPLLALGMWSLIKPHGTHTARRHGLMWAVPLALSLLLALGSHTPLYPATYGLPVWSSFRWPSKFLLFTQLFATVGALWSLQQLRLQRLTRSGLAWLCGFSALAFVILAVVHFNKTNSAVTSAAALLLSGSALSLIALPLLQTHRIPDRLFLSALLLSSVGFISLIHDQNLKPYLDNYQTTRYGFTREYRVMPTDVDAGLSTFRLSALNLGLAATAQGYLSLTGYFNPATPLAFSQRIETYMFGGIARHWLRAMVPTSFLNFFGVRYAIAHTPETVNIFMQDSRYRLTLHHGDIRIFENASALPLVFFAEQSYQGELDWNRPALEVRLSELPEQKWPVGTVTQQRYHLDGDITASGNVRGPGLLVTSTLFLPGWRVSINGGHWQTPLRINDCALGAYVPAGHFHVRWSYRPPGLGLGAAAATAGILILLILRRRYAEPCSSLRPS